MSAEELSKLLDELGSRLGPTGSHVFELAVKQQALSAVVFGFLALIPLVFLILNTIACIIGYARADRRGSDESRGGWTLYWCGSSLIAFLFVVGFLGVFVGAAYNPEYAAIKDLLNSISK